MEAPALLITVALEPALIPKLVVPTMLPELVKLTAPVRVRIPYCAPVMLPQLVMLAAPLSRTTPALPPMLLAPALLLAFAPATARMPYPAVPVMLPQLVTSTTEP